MFLGVLFLFLAAALRPSLALAFVEAGLPWRFLAARRFPPVARGRLRLTAGWQGGRLSLKSRLPGQRIFLAPLHRETHILPKIFFLFPKPIFSACAIPPGCVVLTFPSLFFLFFQFIGKNWNSWELRTMPLVTPRGTYYLLPPGTGRQVLF